MKVWLYSIEKCPACERAEQALGGLGYEVARVPIDNPLVEVGVKLLFRDNLVHAPVAWLPERGAYLFSQDDPPQLLRIVSQEVAP